METNSSFETAKTILTDIMMNVLNWREKSPLQLHESGYLMVVE